MPSASVPSPRVLVVDDDPSLREVVRFALSEAGFAVEEACDGTAGVAKARNSRPDAIVLDVLMPGMDGLEVCRALRRDEGAYVPIVFLSSKDDEVDRIVGLEVGGDDYLAKPFSPRELVARVRAVLRRARAQAGSSGAATGTPAILCRGPLRLDEDEFRAFWNEREVTLTVTEFHLLAALLRAPSKAFTREELMSRVYQDVVVSDRTIDSHIRRVRQKFATLGADVIETVHGLGYRLGLG